MRESDAYEHSLLTSWCELVMVDEVASAKDGGSAAKWSKPGDVRGAVILNGIGNLATEGCVRKVVVNVSKVYSCAAPKFRRQFRL